MGTHLNFLIKRAKLWPLCCRRTALLPKQKYHRDWKMVTPIGQAKELQRGKSQGREGQRTEDIMQLVGSGRWETEEKKILLGLQQGWELENRQRVKIWGCGRETRAQAPLPARHLKPKWRGTDSVSLSPAVTFSFPCASLPSQVSFFFLPIIEYAFSFQAVTKQ